MQTSSPLQVRRVTPEDWRALKQVRLAALEEAPYAYGQRLEQALTIPDEEWQAKARMYATDSACFLAFDIAQPIGMAGAYLEEGAPGNCWLWGVWVAPSYRRTGVGRELILSVEQWARTADARVVKFWVTETNMKAAAFYKQLGYRDTGERNGDGCGACYNASLYAKEVS